MSNGPLPSTLVFLSSLPSLSAGSKVRFLGCVAHYSLSSGTLTLQHAFPPPPAIKTIASVDVSLLLEGLKREDVEVGAWVNVIGYVEDGGKVAGRKVIGNPWGERGVGGEGKAMARIKAILLWSAGGVKLREYEKALEERNRCIQGESLNECI